MKEIKAKEGYYLTQANEVNNRVFITALKGVNIKETDWREATAEELETKVQYDKQMEEYEEDIK